MSKHSAEFFLSVFWPINQSQFSVDIAIPLDKTTINKREHIAWKYNKTDNSF